MSLTCKDIEATICYNVLAKFFKINMDMNIIELRQKVQAKLLEASLNYYEAERACCEMAVPQQWKDDRAKAYEEFVGRCQDYEVVNESDEVDPDDLNYEYS